MNEHVGADTGIAGLVLLYFSLICRVICAGSAKSLTSMPVSNGVPFNDATIVSVAGCAEPNDKGDNTVSIMSTPARIAIKCDMLDVPPMSWQCSNTGSLSLARSLMPLMIR